METYQKQQLKNKNGMLLKIEKEVIQLRNLNINKNISKWTQNK